jgi:Putative manganese efflux pump
VYGLYLVVQAYRTPEPEETDQRLALFGLPLPLSVDNVVAGTSLGLLGFSPWLAPPLFGVVTALMTLVGLQVGERSPTHSDPLRSPDRGGAHDHGRDGVARGQQRTVSPATSGIYRLLPCRHG